MFAYLNALKNVILKPLTVRQLPIHIQVEHTTYCNLNCKSCVQSKYITHATHLALTAFQRIIEQIHPQKITLGGVGEPFMHPDVLDIIRIAKRWGCSINTTTNGTLFAPERCEQIVRSGLDLMKISIDAATRETYQKVRDVDKFEQIVDGIRALTAAKKRFDTRKPFIRLNYVMFKDNYHEMAAIVRLADQLGVDAIYFQPLELVGLEERYALLVGDLTYEAFSQEVRRALTQSRTGRVKTNLESIYAGLPTYWKKYQLEMRTQDQRICILPWFSTYVTVDGIVRPCCSFSHTPADVGNILQDDIQTIWNNEPYQRFRRVMREGKRPYPICQNCVPQTLGDIVKAAGILPGFLR